MNVVPPYCFVRARIWIVHAINGHRRLTGIARLLRFLAQSFGKFRLSRAMGRTRSRVLTGLISVGIHQTGYSVTLFLRPV